jgi:4-hydroxy-3-methylbut-2-enyl diphosphate reductase
VAANVQKQRPVIGHLVGLRDFLLKTNLLLALGAGGLTYACARAQNFPQIFVHSAIAMFYVLSMQIFNNIITIKSDTYNHPARAAFYKKHQTLLQMLALASGGAGLYFAYTTGIVSFWILMVMCLLGLFYNLNSLPFVFGNKRITRIKDVPGSKTILIAIAWGIVTSLLPAIVNSGQLLPLVVTFVFSTGLVFARTAFFDVLAIQGDRITGKETLPILLGAQKSYRLIQYVLTIEIFIVLAAYGLDLFGNTVFWLAFVPLFMLLLIRLYKKDSLLSGRQYEVLIESCFLFAGLLGAFI